MSDFHLTQMGHRFFEGTMPWLVKELSRLNDLLERLAVLLEQEARARATERKGSDSGP